MSAQFRAIAVITLVVLVLVAGGCGSGDKQRIAGLEPDAVVKTFFEEAKKNHLQDAALYIAPDSLNDPNTVVKFLTGQTGLESVRNANLLSVKKVVQQGNFAVVLATVQQEQNTLKVSLRPVGLEKINGEWYILDLDRIKYDAKYAILAQLLNNI